MLDGSIHDGIITHAVFEVTITPENFRRTGDNIFAVSSQEKLRFKRRWRSTRMCRQSPHLCLESSQDGM